MGKNIDELKGIVGQHIPCWAEADVGEIGFARLSGLTNMTYKVTHPSLRPLIFKWFARAEGLLERSRENLIFAELSEEGIGPKCYTKVQPNQTSPSGKYFHREDPTL